MNAAHLASLDSENPFSLNPSSPKPSSLNALKHGLFAARDLIRDGEHEEYAQTLAALTRELSPVGVLETTFSTEIMGATWRLRRCRLIESALAESTDDEAVAKEQKSVDRARAQTFTRLCRAISELRRIQTEQVIREQIHADVPGLTDSKQVVAAMRLQNRARSEVQEQTSDPEASDASFSRPSRPMSAPRRAEPEISFCKPVPVAVAQAPSTPRNSPCPCRSGLKFKRCCGKDAPPVLTMAA
jgi:hypothetical protein